MGMDIPQQFVGRKKTKADRKAYEKWVKDRKAAARETATEMVAKLVTEAGGDIFKSRDRGDKLSHIAIQCGLSPSTLTNLSDGITRNPHARTLQSIANYNKKKFGFG
jgi:hypothetical protein